MPPREWGPSSHVPERTGQGLREVTRVRAALVAQMGDVQRRASSLLDRTFPGSATDVSDVGGQTARTVLEAWAWPAPLAAIPTARLAALLARLSHGHFGTEKARAVQEAAQPRIAVRRAAEALAFERRLLWRPIRAPAQLGADLEREIGGRYAGLAHDWRTIPGLGQATAPAVSVEIGAIRRFTAAEPLVALVGGDPQRHESGHTAGQAKMCTRGSPYRWRAVWPAALAAWRLDPMCQALYECQRGKQHRAARSHVAKKLTRVIYAVLRGQRPYV